MISAILGITLSCDMPGCSATVATSAECSMSQDGEMVLGKIVDMKGWSLSPSLPVSSPYLPVVCPSCSKS